MRNKTFCSVCLKIMFFLRYVRNNWILLFVILSVQKSKNFKQLCHGKKVIPWWDVSVLEMSDNFWRWNKFLLQHNYPLLVSGFDLFTRISLLQDSLQINEILLDRSLLLSELNLCKVNVLITYMISLQICRSNLVSKVPDDFWIKINIRRNDFVIGICKEEIL